MIQTNLLPLQPPYDYIYKDGILGRHIATLIVTQDKTDEHGSYAIETHSHPVVSYGYRLPGAVWDKAELADCRVVCSEQNKTIDFDKLHWLLSLSMDEEDKTDAHMSLLARSLAQNGIKVQLNERMKNENVFDVYLAFFKTDGRACPYSMDFEWGKGHLDFSLKSADIRELLARLSMLSDNLKRMLRDYAFAFHFKPSLSGSFTAEEREQLKELVKSQNEREKEYVGAYSSRS